MSQDMNLIERLANLKDRMDREVLEGADVNALIDKINSTNSKRDGFDPTYFKVMVEGARAECAMYQALGKDFKKELKDSLRLVDSLVCIDQWFRDHNLVNVTSHKEITKFTTMAQVKVGTDSVEMIESKYEVNKDYCFMAGVFTLVNVYVIPLEAVGMDNIKVTDDYRSTFKQLKDTVFHLDTKCRDLLPEDAKMGTAKLVSDSHLLVVCKDDTNPFVTGLNSTRNWRFITSDGSDI